MKCFTFGECKQHVHESLIHSDLYRNVHNAVQKGVYLAASSCARVLACLFPAYSPCKDAPFPCLFTSVLAFALHFHAVPPPCPLTNAPHRCRPPDAAGRCQRGGAAWAPPRSRATDGPCPAFVHERNARNVGLHGSACALQATMTSLWLVGPAGARDCFPAGAGKSPPELPLA